MRRIVFGVASIALVASAALAVERDGSVERDVIMTRPVVAAAAPAPAPAPDAARKVATASRAVPVPVPAGVMRAALPGGAATARRVEPVACRIDVSRGFGGTSLTAKATSASLAPARWRFSVEKSGGGGRSSVTQGGSVDLSAGRPEVLGEVGIGSGGRYTATLELFSSAGNARCRISGP